VLVISTVSAVRAAAASLKQLLHVPTSRVMATMAKRGERQRTYITGNQVQMLCEHVAGYRGGRRISDATAGTLPTEIGTLLQTWITDTEENAEKSSSCVTTAVPYRRAVAAIQASCRRSLRPASIS